MLHVLFYTISSSRILLQKCYKKKMCANTKEQLKMQKSLEQLPARHHS